MQAQSLKGETPTNIDALGFQILLDACCLNTFNL